MAASQVNAAECLSSDACARMGDVEQDYVYMSFQQAQTLGSEFIHASHGMFFARSSRVLWEKVPVRACILMQMRFDGVLGFPGGLVDPGEDPISGLNREMQEELGMQTDKHSFTAADHVETAVHQRKKLVLHFFVKEVSEHDFCQLEQAQFSAPEYGIESLGLVRVPLYTLSDGVRGLPVFLANQFIGNARHQLLKGLSHTQLLTAQELNSALTASDQHIASTCPQVKMPKH